MEYKMENTQKAPQVEDLNVVELEQEGSQLEKLEPIENNTHVDREFSRIREMLKGMVQIDECIAFYQMKKKKLQEQVDYRLGNLENYGLQQEKSIDSPYGKVAVRCTKLKIDYTDARDDVLINWAKEEGYEKDLVKISDPKESFSKSAYKKFFEAKGEVAPGVEIDTDVITAKASVK